MADVVNQKEDSPETSSGENLRQSAETENSSVPKEEALALANARLAELEQVVASRESEIVTLKQARAGLEERLTVLNNHLAEAVASYRAVVVQTNPGVFEELVGGDTVQAINDSLRKAKTLVSKVRQGVEAEIASAKVPVGAPERTPVSLSALSPREKIQYAIGGKR